MPRLVLIFAFLAAASLPAQADKRPVILPDGTVLHGEWGLAGTNNVVPYAEYWGPHYYYMPFAPRGVYYPSNLGDPFAYRSRATHQPSVPGPRYNRSWSTQSNAPADVPPPYMPQGPSVIPAPKVEDK